MASIINQQTPNKASLSAIEKRMHPLVVMLRRSLSPEDRELLDELYESAESNIALAGKTVGLVTDLESILFALLIEQQKRLYLFAQRENASQTDPQR